jgi:hypothetical protein
MVEDAVTYAHQAGAVVVAAAGNDGDDALDNNPAAATYSITVSATDINDGLYVNNSTGEKIDVSAPGVSINTTCLGNTYCAWTGTSLAAPHVSGLAVLLLSKTPTLTNEEIRQLIRTQAVDLGPAGKDINYGYGRIDANLSLLIANNDPLAPILTNPTSRRIITSNTTVTGSVPGPNFASYKLEIGLGRSPSTWQTLTNSTTQVINGTLGTINYNNFITGKYTLRLTGRDTAGKTYQFSVFDLDIRPTDTDGDTVGNGIDNCVSVPNPGQENFDSDGMGNGPNLPGDDETMPNSDAQGDLCDTDDDNDSLLDTDEAVLANCGSFNGGVANHANPARGDKTTEDGSGPSWDTDNDQVLDGVECLMSTNPRAGSLSDRTTCRNYIWDAFGSNKDQDGDKLFDHWEFCKWGTNLITGNTDNEGLGDCAEVADIDGNGSVGDSDRLVVARVALNVSGWVGDANFDIKASGVIDDPDRLFVARAVLLPSFGCF